MGQGRRSGVHEGRGRVTGELVLERSKGFGRRRSLVTLPGLLIEY
jgi:hypothetical protein